MAQVPLPSFEGNLNEEQIAEESWNLFCLFVDPDFEAYKEFKRDLNSAYGKSTADKIYLHMCRRVLSGEHDDG